MGQYIILHYVHILFEYVQKGVGEKLSWFTCTQTHTDASTQHLSIHPSPQWQRQQQCNAVCLIHLFQRGSEQESECGRGTEQQQKKTATTPTTTKSEAATPRPPRPNPIEFRWRRCEFCVRSINAVLYMWPSYVYARNIYIIFMCTFNHCVRLPPVTLFLFFYFIFLVHVPLLRSRLRCEFILTMHTAIKIVCVCLCMKKKYQLAEYMSCHA